MNKEDVPSSETNEKLILNLVFTDTQDYTIDELKDRLITVSSLKIPYDHFVIVRDKEVLEFVFPTYTREKSWVEPTIHLSSFFHELVDWTKVKPYLDPDLGVEEFKQEIIDWVEESSKTEGFSWEELEV